MPSIGGSWQHWALLSAGFAALTAILAKAGVGSLNPDVATWFRTMVVVVVLTAVLLLTGHRFALNGATAKGLVLLVLSGLATGASWVCYFRALKLGPASKVAPIDKLSVVLVAVFGVAFLGERLSPLNWLGVALVGGGAVLLAVR